MDGVRVAAALLLTTCRSLNMAAECAAFGKNRPYAERRIFTRERMPYNVRGKTQP
jgi:hypothetical protein